MKSLFVESGKESVRKFERKITSLVKCKNGKLLMFSVVEILIGVFVGIKGIF